VTRGRWLAAGGCGVLIAALLAVIGIDLPHAVIGGTLWMVGVVVVVHLGTGQRVSLPRLPFDRRDGARTEVSSLSWSLYGSDGISTDAQRHLRKVCLTALDEAGIDLATDTGRERAAALLGSPSTAFLVDGTAPPPDARAVRATVIALEKLEKAQ
jgi:hypothetical protein